MLEVLPSVANVVALSCVEKDSGDPIITGTVRFYLFALTGTNAGKWFRTSDSTWQAAESEAAVAGHIADGHWYASIAAAAWIDGVRYYAYAKQSGAEHIANGADILCRTVLQEGDTVTVAGGTTTMGPLAEDDVEYAEATVFAGETLALGGYVKTWTAAAAAKQADIDRIEYSIVRRVSTDGLTETDTAVPYHTAVPLTISEVIYDTVQTDADWSSYNVKFVPVIYGSNSPFPAVTVNAQGVETASYVVTLWVYLKGGQRRAAKWKVKAI